MKLSVVEELKRNQVLLLDGGLATELEFIGQKLHPLLFNAHLLVDSSDLIEQVHLSYLRSGANIITTASYQVSSQGFERAGYNSQIAEECLRKSVDIAVRSVEIFRNENSTSPTFVAASVGPYGAVLADCSEYSGSYMSSVSHEAIQKFHEERLQVLAKHPGTDIILVETQPSADEVRIILNSLKIINPNVPTCVSFSCRDDQYLHSGERIEDIVKELNEFDQVFAVGANCIHPELVLPIIQNIKKHTSKFVIVYPNSGETWDVSKTWKGRREGVIEDLFHKWVEAGVNIIGGCCRTRPETISFMRRTLESSQHQCTQMY
eukprot:TRINITY_DN11000_c0_g1_i4.p1 TRINITY_DN11000_c0_g1~~TRINITY_DN11000_c0_g1_i4.p1  ORF type:complete len:320 (-),score=53.40 TRINITY_DN11000_c0_g1_i4:149-1108(-)